MKQIDFINWYKNVKLKYGTYITKFSARFGIIETRGFLLSKKKKKILQNSLLFKIVVFYTSDIPEPHF